MVDTVRSLVHRCETKTNKDLSGLSMDELRRKASKMGLSKVRTLSRSSILVELHKPAVKQQKLTLQQLHIKVREKGGNPQPVLKSGKRGSWSYDECRRFLLCKRTLPELRSMLIKENKRQRTDKNSLIETLLKESYLDCSRS